MDRERTPFEKFYDSIEESQESYEKLYGITLLDGRIMCKDENTSLIIALVISALAENQIKTGLWEGKDDRRGQHFVYENRMSEEILPIDRLVADIEETTKTGVYLSCGVRTNGEEILCKKEMMAELIANILDAVEGKTVCVHTTGSYDKEEDERNGCVDSNTGWYYVSVS